MSVNAQTIQFFSPENQSKFQSAAAMLQRATQHRGGSMPAREQTNATLAPQQALSVNGPSAPSQAPVKSVPPPSRGR